MKRLPDHNRASSLSQLFRLLGAPLHVLGFSIVLLLLWTPWLPVSAAAKLLNSPGNVLGITQPVGKTQHLTSPEQVPNGVTQSDWQSIRAAYEAGRHAFQPVASAPGHWQAQNPGQHWQNTFDGRGFVTKPQHGDWSWGLALQSYGFGAVQQPGGQPAQVGNARHRPHE